MDDTSSAGSFRPASSFGITSLLKTPSTKWGGSVPAAPTSSQPSPGPPGTSSRPTSSRVTSALNAASSSWSVGNPLSQSSGSPSQIPPAPPSLSGPPPTQLSSTSNSNRIMLFNQSSSGRNVTLNRPESGVFAASSHEDGHPFSSSSRRGLARGGSGRAAADSAALDNNAVTRGTMQGRRSTVTAPNFTARPYQHFFYKQPRPFVLDDSDVAEVWLELFIDLIFVVAALKIGSVINYCSGYYVNEHDVGVDDVGEYGVGDHEFYPFAFSFTVFVMFWLSWLHFTTYLNRFYTEDLAHKLLFLTFMIGAAGMVVNVNDTTDGNSLPSCANKWWFAVGFMVSFLITRLVLILLHLSVMHGEDKAGMQRQFGPQVAGWVVCILLVVAFCSVGQHTESMPLYLLVFFIIESATYLWQTYRSHVALNVEHFHSRNGTFIMVMLGECVIQLLIPNIKDSDHMTEHYNFSFLGMAFLIMLALQFFDCEPEFGQHVLLHSAFRGRCWIFLHCFLAYSLLVTGIGLKSLAHATGHGSVVSSSASIFIGVGATMSGMLITSIRIMHKGVRSFSERRFVTYVLRFVLTALHLTVHYFANESTGYILSFHLLIALCIVTVDTVGQRNKAKKRQVGGEGSGSAQQHGRSYEDQKDSPIGALRNTEMTTRPTFHEARKKADEDAEGEDDKFESNDDCVSTGEGSSGHSKPSKSISGESAHRKYSVF